MPALDGAAALSQCGTPPAPSAGMWITTPEPALPPELAALIALGWITLGLVLIRVLSRPSPRG